MYQPRKQNNAVNHFKIASLLLYVLVINCTLLSVNPNGPLRMGSCGNHYGSRCNFSCDIGHQLSGSSTLTCLAYGNRPPAFWDNLLPVCQGQFRQDQSFFVRLKVTLNFATHLWFPREITSEEQGQKIASSSQKHYPDLGSASDWSCRLGNLIQPITSTTQIWVVTRHQYGIFALVP